MKAEHDPITDDEWLLRRVHFQRFRTDRTPIISRSAFEPRIQGRDPDTDGISFYRAACLNDPEEILAMLEPQRREENGIVRLQVSFLKSLHLSVVSKPDARVKGHVVIPELNAQDYQVHKDRLLPVLLRMAEEASKNENIVRRPLRRC